MKRLPSEDQKLWVNFMVWFLSTLHLRNLLEYLIFFEMKMALVCGERGKKRKRKKGKISENAFNLNRKNS